MLYCLHYYKFYLLFIQLNCNFVFKQQNWKLMFVDHQISNENCKLTKTILYICHLNKITKFKIITLPTANVYTFKVFFVNQVDLSSWRL